MISAEEVRAGILRVNVEVPIFPGVDFIESTQAVKREEDWSRVRSRSRAARRRAQGKRQNIEVTEKPAAFFVGGVCYCHPEIMAKLKRELGEQIDREYERALMRCLR